MMDWWIDGGHLKRNHLLSLTLLVFIPCSAFSQQPVNNSNGKNQIYMPDTSEVVLVKSFRNKMDNSETVMDAQVISKVSKWRIFKDDQYFDNRREHLYSDNVQGLSLD